MISFNLLPYRQEAAQRYRQSFTPAMILAAFCAMIMVGMLHTLHQLRMQTQQERSDLLNNELKNLTAQRRMAEQLALKIASQSRRQQAIQALNLQRDWSLSWLQALSKYTPSGVRLLQFKQLNDKDGTLATFQGQTVASEQVAQLLRNFSLAEPSLGVSELIEVMAGKLTRETYPRIGHLNSDSAAPSEPNGKSVYQFSIRMRQRHAETTGIAISHS